MSRRQKIVTGVGIFFIGLLFVIIPLYPYFVGLMIEKTVNQGLEQARIKGKDKVDISWNLERSYGSSTFKGEVRQLSGELRPALTFSIKMNHWGLSGEGTIEGDRDFELTYLNNFSKIPTVNVKMALNFLGTIKGEIALGELAFETDKNNIAHYVVEIPTTLLKIKLSSGGIELVDTYLPKLEIKNDNGATNVENFSLLWKKDRGLRSTDSLIFLKADSYQSNNINLKNADIFLGVLNIDNKVLDRVSSMLSEISKNSGQGINQNALMASMQLLPRFLERKPRFEVQIKKMETNEGVLEGNAFLGVNSGDGKVSLFTFMKAIEAKIFFKGPEKIITGLIEQYLYWKYTKDETQRLYAEQSKNSNGEKASMSALSINPEKLADLKKEAEDQAPFELEKYFDSNYFVKEKEGVVVNFELENGAMTLNGGPFSMPQFGN